MRREVPGGPGEPRAVPPVRCGSGSSADPGVDGTAGCVPHARSVGLHRGERGNSRKCTGK